MKEADIVIYAGSLVNPGLPKLCKEKCEIYNSAKMTLEEVLEVMVKGHGDGKEIVRLHTGDPCLYGAIREQMDELKKLEIPYEDCRVSVHFAELRQHWKQSIHCREFLSLS